MTGSLPAPASPHPDNRPARLLRRGATLLFLAAFIACVTAAVITNQTVGGRTLLGLLGIAALAGAAYLLRRDLTHRST